MQRLYQATIEEQLSHDRQMVFLAGPRQVGKTTLGKQCLEGKYPYQYLNWDSIALIFFVSLGFWFGMRAESRCREKEEKEEEEAKHRYELVIKDAKITGMIKSLDMVEQAYSSSILYMPPECRKYYSSRLNKIEKRLDALEKLTKANSESNPEEPGNALEGE